MNKEAEKIIKALNLSQHPEGGYYREIYRSEFLTGQANQLEFKEKRNLATSIYFLLQEKQVSHFHQLTSDEIWYFHAGCSVKIYTIDKVGNLKISKLGADIAREEKPQIIIPAGVIFGAEITDKESFALIGCLVAPGFEFKDFRLFTRKELLDMFVQHTEIIYKLTKN